MYAPFIKYETRATEGYNLATSLSIENHIFYSFQFCPGSCGAQAWSIGCTIEAIYDLIHVNARMLGIPFPPSCIPTLHPLRRLTPPPPNMPPTYPLPNPTCYLVSCCRWRRFMRLLFVPESQSSSPAVCLLLLAGLGTLASTALPGTTPMAGASGGGAIRPGMAGGQSVIKVSLENDQLRILCNIS